MSTILFLIEEVPWVMAPATLIAAISVETLVSVVNLNPFTRLFGAGLSSEII